MTAGADSDEEQHENSVSFVFGFCSDKKGITMCPFFKSMFILFILSFLIPSYHESDLRASIWKNYTNTDVITSIASTENELWVGTDGGLIRIDKTNYDKEYFYSSNSGLTQNWIRSIACHENTVWIGTNQRGIVELKNDIWNQYLMGKEIGVSPYVYTIYFDGESFWVGTEHGLIHIREDEWEEYHSGDSGLADNDVKSIIKHDNYLWIGTENGLSRFDGKDWFTYNMTNSNLEYNSIHKLASVGTLLWVSVSHGMFTDEYSLYSFNNEIFEKQTDIPSNDIRDLNSFDHLLWVATSDGLLCLMNEKWTTYDTSNTIFKTNRVGPLHADSTSLWIGSLHGEVYKYEENNWTSIKLSSNTITSNNVGSVESDMKNLWIGCAGLVRFDGKNWEIFNDNNSPLSSSYIFALKFIDDKLWIGGRDLFSFDGTDWQVYETPRPRGFSNITIMNICEYDSAIWLGTSNDGLVKKRGDHWEIFDPSSSEIPSKCVEALASNDEFLWIGTWNGLIRYDGQNWKQFHKLNSGISSNGINALAVQDSILWVGTGYGLNKYNGETWEVFDEFNSFLKSNTILSLAVQEDTLWIGTDYALYKYDGKNAVCYTSGNSGLPGILIRNLCVDENGILIGTQSGVGYFGMDFNTVIDRYNETEDIQTFILCQNNPNPFNNSTKISFQIDKFSNVEAGIFNIVGEKVSTIFKGVLDQGEYHYRWNGRDYHGKMLPSGLYICRLNVDNHCQTRKIILHR
ncbi:T9SS type A sorting domain-containing protein [bacterium]|nr:T9SS type A sorting domain-containing protein [bacterium]